MKWTHRAYNHYLYKDYSVVFNLAENDWMGSMHIYKKQIICYRCLILDEKTSEDMLARATDWLKEHDFEAFLDEME